MNDTISVYSGVKPEPVGTATWQSALENIRSEKYRPAIEAIRQVKADTLEYRKRKTKLPAVTFCGQFQPRREAKNVIQPTGFIIPDLDHLPDVEAAFELLTQDPYCWFAFRSPGGDGIKCGIRAQAISTDDDIKRMFEAVFVYFKDTYGINIDPTCKNIDRLTFVSYDPRLWINPEPEYFPIDEWLIKPKKAEPYKPVSTGNGWKAKYGLKVLESCYKEIAESTPGNQHAVRLRRARLVGGFIPDGYLDEQEAITALENAVRASGAKNIHAAMKTIRDGIEYGKKSPIIVQERPQNIPQDIEYYMDDSYFTNKADEVQCSQMRSDEDSWGHLRTSEDICGHHEDIVRTSEDILRTNSESDKRPLAYSLATVIEEYVTNSDGSFTADQVDKEFCLKSRQEKKNRHNILTRLLEKKIIYKDKTQKGKYHVLNSTVEWLDIDKLKVEAFPIKLPFGLHDQLVIPHRGIIVIAGSSNAGKTALMLNILNDNLPQKYEKIYMMSEMAGSEYKSRITNFGGDINRWKQVRAAERSSGFEGVIEHHNKNGLTCIDFLEEIDGKYYLIASSIRAIYDSLGKGVAVVAIQKSKNLEYARGGEATAEKARLYMTVDLITVKDKAIICALKLIKVKHPKNDNLQNHEIHFRIDKGCFLTPLTGWRLSSTVDRAKDALIYESDRDPEEVESRNYAYTFKTMSGKLVGVNYDQRDRWMAEFGYFVDDELFKLQESSHKKPFLRDKWFFQVAGILAKRKEQQENREAQRADIHN